MHKIPEKGVFYKAVLPACPSFLNGMKKEIGNVVMKKYGKE